MSLSPGFREFLVDQMADFGTVTVKSMFGGAGVYREGRMFALVADDVLYFKADDVSLPDFMAENLAPFVYGGRKGSAVTMRYYRAPARCLDDPAEMTAWCGKAEEAAVRARKPRPR